jgi:hypothetical protein
MGQTANWGEVEEGLAQVWRCRCWDCRAHQRHVLRMAALLMVLMGLTCGWAIEVEASQLGPEVADTVTGDAGAGPWF